MRRSYVVPMRWMVIYEYEVAGGALNLNSTKLPRPWSPGQSSPSRKNPCGRTGHRTRDLMITNQKLWPPDHEAGPTEIFNIELRNKCTHFGYSVLLCWGSLFFSLCACFGAVCGSCRCKINKGGPLWQRTYLWCIPKRFAAAFHRLSQIKKLSLLCRLLYLHLCNIL
jgi:hypothetical protein